MNKVTAIVIVILILCFGGLIVWSISNSRSKSIDFDAYNPSTIISPNTSNGEIGDHARGNIDSPVIFVEYADFQCAGCASMHPRIDTLLEEYGDRVAFVFRNFPIKGHSNSRAAAGAAEAAGLQGSFFAMTTTIFNNQAVWSNASGTERASIFVDLFRQIAPDGNIDQFKSDMGSSRVTKKIDFDYNLGAKKDNVTGTPSIHINGEHIVFPRNVTAAEMMDIMREKIDARLVEFSLPAGPNK
jgi:protein-disulfide isomerase